MNRGRGAAFLVALVAASAGGSSDAALATEPSPRERVAKVACYEPEKGAWGLRQVSRCAGIQKIRRLPNGVWWVQLRRPPVYCYEVRLGYRSGDDRVDVPGVGLVLEVRCPASAYANEGKPDVRVLIRGFAPESRHRGLSGGQ